MSKIYYINKYFPNNNLYKEDVIIIENILETIKKNESLDIRKIAENNYTSPSSISRLARRAGFNNFKEFIFFLKNKFNNNSKNIVTAYPLAISNYDIQTIDEFFKSAFDNKKIYLFGEGFCQFLVDYTYRKLLLKKIYSVNLDGVEISFISDNTPHTLITFSHSGENKNGLQKIEECKEFGGKTIAFTARENSSYTKVSDLFFVVDNGNNEIDFENQSLNLFFGNTLNLLENIINRNIKPTSNVP